VSDFSNVGYPQLGMWMKSAKKPTTPDKIVDFNYGISTCSDDCSLSNILQEKNQVCKL
jgi:hypothetical protein